MARRLIDMIQEEESKQFNDQGVKVRRPIEQIIGKEGAKDKQISVKVNHKMYAAFTTINKRQGLTNNSSINMLIARYVRENVGLLDNEV